MGDKIASFRLPSLWDACPAWEATGVREWATPLPPEMERSRSIGRRVPVGRAGGGLLWGEVLGSTAPAAPSEGEVLRGGEALCARGVQVRTDGGKILTLGSARLRELRRSPRAVEPGAGLPWYAAEEVVADARAALAAGDVAGSDAARGGTLPYPHRAGSTPCSGSSRPALVLADFDAWREGEGFDNWSREDALGRAREMLKGVSPLLLHGEGALSISAEGDVLPVALAVEGYCVDLWEKWVDRGKLGQREQVREKRAAIRELFPSARKHSAAVVKGGKGGRISHGPVTSVAERRSAKARRRFAKEGLTYFRAG